MRTLLAALLVASSLLAVPAVAGQTDPLGGMTASASLELVHATAGSRCTFTRHEDGTASSVCADAAYPLAVQGSLRLRPGHQVALDFSSPVDIAWIRLLTPSGQPVMTLQAVPFGTRRSTRWVFSLPGKLPQQLGLLDVVARWDPDRNPTGTTNFQAGVRVARPVAPSVRVPILAGERYRSAMKRLDARGLRWRLGKGKVRSDPGPLRPPGIYAIPDPLDDRIVATRPRAGTRVRAGTVITLRAR